MQKFNLLSHACILLPFCNHFCLSLLILSLTHKFVPHIKQFDLASSPLQQQQQHYPKYYLQQQPPPQQQQQHHSLNTQSGLVIASCQGSYQTTPLTGLNTAQQHTTLDRFQTPPSPSLFVSASSTNPVCNSNEPVSIHEIYCYCFHIVDHFRLYAMYITFFFIILLYSDSLSITVSLFDFNYYFFLCSHSKRFTHFTFGAIAFICI